jgi:D-amino-acid dehydrogenase
MEPERHPRNRGQARASSAASAAARRPERVETEHGERGDHDRRSNCATRVSVRAMAIRLDLPRTVLVVGAGIVGVSAALWLLRGGHRVTLVDRSGPCERASFGNGGVLASCAVVPVTGPGLLRSLPRLLLDPDSPLFVNWRYVPKLAPYLARYLRACRAEETRRIATALLPLIGDSLEQHRALARGTPAERWLHGSDYLYVYPDRSAFAAEEFGWNVRRELGFTWREVGPDALRASAPLLSEKFSFGVRLADHGTISDPGRYVQDLARYAETNGARIVKADVTAMVLQAGRVTGVIAGGERIAADAVVLATGAWSKQLAGSVGVAVPLESERGYHLELLEPSAMPTLPVMVAAGKFVITPMDGRIRIAGLVEFGGLQAGPNRKAFAHLERLAHATMPRLKWRATGIWMGHRPSPADSIPVIGPVPGAEGLFMAFGHHHVGLTAGPKTGRILAGLLGGERPNIDLAPYRPDRFYRRANTGRE